jgi:hypothetical protein
MLSGQCPTLLSVNPKQAQLRQSIACPILASGFCLLSSPPQNPFKNQKIKPDQTKSNHALTQAKIFLLAAAKAFCIVNGKFYGTSR